MAYDSVDDRKSPEELIADIEIEIQALGINLVGSLRIVQLLLYGLLILGIVALIHFW